MSVRWIIGRAGSGKTHWCVEETVRACKDDPLGPPILWLVPRQATFQTERDLCCARGLSGYVRVRVLSLDALAREVMSQAGSAARTQITDAGRLMLLAHVLRELQPSLQFFGSVAHKPSLAAELAATFAEFERVGVDPDALPQEVETLFEKRRRELGSGDALLLKLRDLQLLHRRYTELLGPDRLDTTGHLTAALKKVEDCRLLCGATVYVDGYYDYTDFETQMLTAIAGIADQVRITATLDPKSALVSNPHLLPEELSLFHRTELAYRRLQISLQRHATKLQVPLLFPHHHRYHNHSLAELENWDHRPPAGERDVALIEAASPAREVDAAARQIQRWVRQGLRYRDIGVLTRDANEYLDLLAASFAEHQIPFFADRRRSAMHHPLVQFIRGANAIADGEWAHQEMMTLIKSGLMGLTPDEGDELENYVLLHGIRGQTWDSPTAWTGRRAVADENLAGDVLTAPDAESAERLRQRVMSKLRPFVAAQQKAEELPVADRATALFQLIEACQARQTLAGWIADAGVATDAARLEEAQEHQQVWKNLVELFEQLVELLGEHPITTPDFSTTIDSALERFDLALTPPTVDQVLVGSVERTRTPRLKAVVVLGLNEGQFPRKTGTPTVFTDADRTTLHRGDIRFAPASQRLALDEEFWGYLALTRASHHLAVSRHRSDANGRAIAGSSLWRRAALYGRKPGDAAAISGDASANTTLLEATSTPRQLVTSLMAWARSASDVTVQAHSSWAALYQWFARHDHCHDAVGQVRHRAWRALAYQNQAALSADIAAQLFATPLKTTARAMEAFASCPFQHFAAHGLRLAPRIEQQVSVRDLSGVYHRVLDRLLNGLLVKRADWCDLSPDAVRGLVAQHVGAIGASLKGELMISSARNRYLLGRVERTLCQVIAAQQAAHQRGSLRPKFTQLGFGPGKKLQALRLQTHRDREVLLSGHIDRIDVVGNEKLATVVDYRLGASGLSLVEAFWGRALSLMTAVLALVESGDALGRGFQPIGALSVPLLRKICDGDPAEALAADHPDFHLRLKPRGVVDAQFLAAFDRTIAPGVKSAVISASMNKDGRIAARSDALSTEEHRGLLHHTREKLMELADRLIEGEVTVRPYRLGTTSACSYCDFRDLCRFEPMINRYFNPEITKRDEIRDHLREVGEELGA